jgi:hypothetical protein
LDTVHIECLALGLVDSHGHGQFGRELLAVDWEREVEIVGNNHSRQPEDISLTIPSQNFYFKETSVHVDDAKPRPIAHSSADIQVVDQHDNRISAHAEVM